MAGHLTVIDPRRPPLAHLGGCCRARARGGVVLAERGRASGAQGPAAIAALVREAGVADSRGTVLEALGGPRERVRATTARGFDVFDVDDLNVVAVVVEADPGARVVARAPGLADDMSEHDGQITKREIRALTLSALAPRRRELLWDIGAGSGSVAIEWMRADPSLRAIAVERRRDRASRIRRNAAVFGVPGLQVIEGEAPAVLQGLEAPDAVFIGGGVGAALDAVLPRLRSEGRLVVNAVTLETEAMLLVRYATLGGELTRIAVARADRITTSPASGWRAGRPVTQWLWIKP